MCELSELSELSRSKSRPRTRENGGLADNAAHHRSLRRCKRYGIYTYINPMHFEFVQEDLDIYFLPGERGFQPGRRTRWKGCARLIRPMYTRANMGHPSRVEGLVISSCILAMHD
jgi:hypothetical protein